MAEPEDARARDALGLLEADGGVAGTEALLLALPPQGVDAPEGDAPLLLEDAGGGQAPPGAMPVELISCITPVEALRWHTPRKEEANRWERKPASERLDKMVLAAYGTPVGHWKFFHSRSTTHTAPPHAPPCGREAPQGRIDQREYVVARSVDEAARVLETHYCKDLDFTHNVAMSHPDVPMLQQPFREDDATADYSKLAVTQALVVRRAPPGEARDREQESADEAAISRLREVQQPAVRLMKLVAANPSLHTLRIDCKHLGEEALCTLAASLDTNTSLRFLDCSSNHITPHAAGLLGYALRKHPLQELHLNCSNMGANGAHHFAASLYGNSTLRTLGLRGNKIGPGFPKPLLWLLTPLPVSQGGGSSTKKDPNGPPIDDKGARFQCPIVSLLMDDNPLKDLPVRLGSISASVEISLARCAIEHPPPEIVSQGWSAIRHDLKIEYDEYEDWHAEQVVTAALSCVACRGFVCDHWGAHQARRRPSPISGALTRSLTRPRLPFVLLLVQNSRCDCVTLRWRTTPCDRSGSLCPITLASLQTISAEPTVVYKFVIYVLAAIAEGGSHLRTQTPT